MRILLVDDSKTMRNSERKVISAMGDAEFTEAGDGIEALTAIATAAFDLVIIDWIMPAMDGLTLVRKIRETDTITPLVMATTETAKARVLEAIKAGVNNYIVKPFTPEQLTLRVRQTLEKAKAGKTAADGATPNNPANTAAEEPVMAAT